MPFRISSTGTLAGDVRLPGDRGLTLSIMAFGMISGRSVTLAHPSPALDVERFRRFLESTGARFTPTPEGFILHGRAPEGEISVPDDLPAEVFHIMTASAAFSQGTVRIVNRSTRRDRLLRGLIPLLLPLGLGERDMREEGGDLIISAAGSSLPERVSVSSPLEFETAVSAAMASRRPVVIAHPAHVVSPTMRILDSLGARGKRPENRDGGGDELARRLAKMSRERPLVESRFEWDCADCEIRIPGDTSLAAALAGAGAVLARSDITIRNVLCEQGRKGFFEALRRMRGTIEMTPTRGYSFDAADFQVRGSSLEGIHLTPPQARTMRSELMILGAVAASAKGKTILGGPDSGPNLERATFRALKSGLETLGAHIGDYRDGIVVKGPREMSGAEVDSDGVPGVALALAVAGLTAAGSTDILGFTPDEYPIREFLAITSALSEREHRSM